MYPIRGVLIHLGVRDSKNFRAGEPKINDLTANDFSGSHHRGEIAGSKSLGANAGIINKVIKVRPPDGGRSENIT